MLLASHEHSIAYVPVLRPRPEVTFVPPTYLEPYHQSVSSEVSPTQHTPLSLLFWRLAFYFFSGEKEGRIFLLYHHVLQRRGGAGESFFLVNGFKTPHAPPNRFPIAFCITFKSYPRIPSNLYVQRNLLFWRTAFHLHQPNPVFPSPCQGLLGSVPASCTS